MPTKKQTKKVKETLLDHKDYVLAETFKQLLDFPKFARFVLDHYAITFVMDSKKGQVMPLVGEKELGNTDKKIVLSK